MYIETESRPLRPIEFGDHGHRTGGSSLSSHDADLLHRSIDFAKAVSAASDAETRVEAGDGWAQMKLRQQAADAYHAAWKAGLDFLEAAAVTDDYWVQTWKARGEVRLARIAALSKSGLLGPVTRGPDAVGKADDPEVWTAVLDLYHEALSALARVPQP